MRNDFQSTIAEEAIRQAATARAEAPVHKRKTRKPNLPPSATPPTAGSPLPFDRPAYMAIPTWCAFTGMTRTGVYEAVAFGKLATIKVGKKRLVDVEQGLTWLRSLAAAKAA